MGKTTTFNLTDNRKETLRTIYRISKGMQEFGDFVSYSTYRKFEEAGYVYRQENLEWALTTKGLDALHLTRPETPAAETSERARITPADAVALLGDDESAPEWTPQSGDKVYMRLTNEYGVIGRVLTVMGITLYDVAFNEGTSREFYRDEIEFVNRPVEPTPAPVEPLGELEALRTALREIARLTNGDDALKLPFSTLANIRLIAQESLGIK